MDTRISFFVVFALSYLYYLSHLFTFGKGAILLFPNIFLFFYISLVGLVIMSSMQEIDHWDVSTRNIVRWQLLALIPSLLMVKVLSDLKNEHKTRGNDPYLIRGIQVMRFIFILFTVILISLVILILALTADIRILEIAVFSSIGMIGYSLGYYLSMLRSNPSVSLVLFEQHILRRIIGSRRGRIVTQGLFLGFLLVLMVLDNLLTFEMVTVR